MEVLIFFLLLWTGFGLFGAWVSTQKHRSPAEGLILGFLFGPLGVLVSALLPSQQPVRSKRPARGGRRGEWMPDYDPAWDAPKPPDPRQAVEDEVMGFLSDIGGKPRETIDMAAIAEAEEERRRKNWEGE